MKLRVRVRCSGVGYGVDSGKVWGARVEYGVALGV